MNRRLISILNSLEGLATAIGGRIVRSRPIRWLGRKRSVRVALGVLVALYYLIAEYVWWPIKRLLRRTRHSLIRNEVWAWVLTILVCLGIAQVIMMPSAWLKLYGGALAAGAFLIVAFRSPLAGMLIWLLMSPWLNSLIRFKFLPGTPIITGDRVCIAILLAVLLAYMRRREGNSEPQPWLHLSMFAFVGAMLLAVIPTENFRSTAQQVLDVHFAPILAYLFARRWITNKKHLSYMFVIMIIVGIYYAGLAIPEHFLGRTLLRPISSQWIEEELGTVRIRGPAATPQELGMVMLYVMTFAIVAFAHARESKKRLTYALVAGITFTAIALTLRRGVYASVILAMGMLLFGSRHVRKYVLLGAVLGSIALVGAWPFMTQSEFYSVRMTTKGPIYQRAVVQSTAWNIIKQNPISGVGIGRFRDVRDDYLVGYKDLLPHQARGLRSPHSSYLRVLVEGGLVAFVPFALMLILMGAKSVQAYRRAEPGGLLGRDGIVAFWGVSLAILAEATSTDSFLSSTYLMTIWFATFGAIVGVYLQRSKMPEEMPLPAREPRNRSRLPVTQS